MDPAPDPKRLRILDSAREVFLECGFEAARMDEVARRARVSKGTVYNHVDSKESLLVECVLHQMAETRERIDALVRRRQGRPGRALVVALRALILDLLPRIGRESLNYQVWSLVARDAGVRERVFSEYRKFWEDREQRLRDGLSDGAARGDFRSDVPADDLALLILATFDGLVYRSMFDPGRIEPERVLDTLLQLLESGLGCPAGLLTGDGESDGHA